MAFLDDVSGKMKNKVESSRLSGMVSDEKKSLDNAYIALGKAYYGKHKNSPDPDFRQSVSAISGHISKIDGLEEQIQRLRGFVICETCRSEVPVDSQFCNKCGKAMPPPPSVQVHQAQHSPQSVFCNKCGTPQNGGSAFCNKCGNPMQAAVPPVMQAPAPAPMPVPTPVTTPPPAPMPAPAPVATAEPVVAPEIVCKGCGTVLSAANKFCLRCGTKVE